MFLFDQNLQTRVDHGQLVSKTKPNATFEASIEMLSDHERTISSFKKCVAQEMQGS